MSRVTVPDWAGLFNDPSKRATIWQYLGAPTDTDVAAAFRKALGVNRLSHLSESCLLSNGRASSGSGITTTFRQRYLIPRDCPFIEVTWLNYCLSDAVPTDPFLMKAAWDYGPAGATMGAGLTRYDINFPNGSSSWTLNWKQAATVKIYGPFFAGDYVWIRSYLEQVASKFYPVGCELANNGEGKNTSDIISTANATASFTTDFSRNNFGPTLVTAPDSNGKKSFVLIGDSIFDGAGDDVRAGNRGFGARACSTLGFGCQKAALAGDRVALIASQMGYRSFGFEYGDWAVSEYGTNDIGVGDSWQTVASNLIKLWKQLKTFNLKVIQTTILPKVSTTDVCLTIANQTQTAYEANRVALNTWLRNGCLVDNTGSPVLNGSSACPYIDRVCDVCAVVEVNSNNVLTQNGGYWKVPTTIDKSGTATGGSTTTLVDSSNPFSTSGEVGDRNRVVQITGGTGAGQTRLIAGITSSTATVATWTAPTAGSTYSIWTTMSFDGTHPTYFGHILLSNALVGSMI